MAAAKPSVENITELYVWGSDGYGRLGQGTVNKHLLEAKKVKNLEGKIIKSIGCGSAHTILACYEEGGDETKLECFSWGKCHYGQLGHGEMEIDESVPKQLTVLGDVKRKVKLVGCGQSFSFIVTEDGTYSWGCGYYGALGHGNEDHLKEPKLIEWGDDWDNGRDVKSIKGGAFHTVALKEDGSVFTWGRDNLRQLGVKPLCETTQVRLNHKTPQNVPLPEVAVKIDAFADNTKILLKDGILLSFGDNTHGQLGHKVPSFNANKDANIKGKLESRVDIKEGNEYVPISDMACGSTHSLAVSRKGVLYSWGRADLGALGRKDLSNAPKIVEIKENDVIIVFTKVSAGHETSLALASDGRVFSWGENYLFKLGREINTDSPAVVESLEGVFIDGIICAENHCTAYLCMK